MLHSRQRIIAAIRDRSLFKTSPKVALTIPSKTSAPSLIQTRDYWATRPTEFIKIPKDLVGNLSSAVETAKNTIFDLMAKNMNEKDVKKFVDHWKNQSPDGNSSIDTSNLTQRTQNLPQKEVDLKEVAPIPDKPIPTEEEIEKMFKSQKDCELYHPQLGELVADYGYKRIYQTSVNALSRTPVWKKQRILRPERATLIAEDKIRKKITSQLPGVITLFQNQETKEIGIIDGQHRVGALMILAQRGYWNPNERNVVLEVFSTNSENDVSVLFRVINAAEPVRLIDMPDNETIDAESEEEEEPIITTVTKVTETEPNTKPIEPKVKDKKESEVIPVPEVQQTPITVTVPVSTVAEPTIIPTSTESTPAIQPAIDSSSIKTEAQPTNPSNPVSDSVQPSLSLKADSTQEQITSDSSSKVEKVPTKPKKSSKKTPKKLSNEQITEIINEGVKELESKYGEMFKPTSRCKAPHVNNDALRDDLFTTNFLFIRHIQTTEQLLQVLNEVNEELHLKYQAIAENESNTSYTKSFQTALKKAQKFHFYLGMEKSWMDPPTSSEEKAGN